MCATLIVWVSVLFSPTVGLVVLVSLSSQWREVDNAREIYLFQTSSVLGVEQSLQRVPGDLFG